MNTTTIRALLFALATSAFAAPVHAISYTVTLLQPAGYGYSNAWGADGTSQVGYATNSSSREHAILWNGTAESFVDLNPPGFETSFIYGVSGDHQVGTG